MPLMLRCGEIKLMISEKREYAISDLIISRKSGRGELTSEYSVTWVRVRVRVRVGVRVPVRVGPRVRVRVRVGVRVPVRVRVQFRPG